jgi:hypothetical protein
MQVKNLARTAVLGVATLASASSFAFMEDMFDFDGVYALGGIVYGGVEDAQWGDRNVNFQSNRITGSNLEAAGELGWRGGLGAWLADDFAIEFNYIGLGDINEDRNGTLIAGDQTTPVYGQLNTTDSMFFDLSALSRCYFDEDLWAFARLGVAVAKVKREMHFNHVQAAEQDEAGWGFSLGLGAQYDFTEMFGVRLEASTIQAANDNDLYAISANVVVNFEELM